MTPASGTAPRDVSVAVNTAGLAAGTYTATVTVDGDRRDRLAEAVPVTLTVSPRADAGAGVTAVEPRRSPPRSVGANPAAKSLSVANTGGGTLSFTAADNATWLAVSPASGTAPASLSGRSTSPAWRPARTPATVTVTASRRDRLAAPRSP